MAASLRVNITVTPGADRFFRLIDRIKPTTHLAIRDALHDTGNESSKFMKRKLSTGPKTGRRRLFGIDRQASAPGEFPARITGKLVRNVSYDVRGTSELEVGVKGLFDFNYPLALEVGTINMEPRPYIAPTSDAYTTQLANELMYYSRVRVTDRLGQRLF